MDLGVSASLRSVSLCVTPWIHNIYIWLHQSASCLITSKWILFVYIKVHPVWLHQSESCLFTSKCILFVYIKVHSVCLHQSASCLITSKCILFVYIKVHPVWLHQSEFCLLRSIFSLILIFHLCGYLTPHIVIGLTRASSITVPWVPSKNVSRFDPAVWAC